jgi:16S rRNA A1518/A1519 N6-dimethyltransferase RsmA/KsgA/DIM1 with predicted DNA glycosylase/AP lyase activity
VSARRRTDRDWRRRQLGQNFLDPATADQIVDQAAFAPGELVLDHGVRVIERDFLAIALPHEPFRVFGSLPFARTTDILHRLLDDPAIPMRRADVIVQWEVAVKRAASPPVTLVSTAWAPWWEVHVARRIPAAMFRPVPRVDGGLLTITRRDPPLLPAAMARPYADFVQREWPFESARQRSRFGPSS